MAGNRKSGGSNVGLTTRMRRSGGVNVALTIARRRASGAWVNLFSDHVVSPDNYGANVANGTHNFSVSSNVTGGVGPFTYSWTWESGGLNMSITNATSAACDVASTGTNQQNSGIIKCTVVDTGNGNLSKSGTGQIDVIHGTPV